MTFTEMESGNRSIPIYMSDIDEVLDLKGSGTIKAIRDYQYFSTSFCDIIPQMILEFETLQIVQIILQIIIRIGNNWIHGNNIYLRSSSCQWHQSQYLLMNII